MVVSSKSQPISRIETLDWLRGLMALSIMIYHLNFWNQTILDSSDIFGRLGIYAVSIFFILSGLSMAIVYNKYINSIHAFINFYIFRLFRIWPLLWAVSIFTILPQIIITGSYDWFNLFLNLTTLFGFFDTTGYIATGAWSIGNEIVYYSMTPFVFLIFNYKRWLGNLILFFCILIGLYFAFVLFDPSRPLNKQWSLYVNPFNNFFLYVLGIAMYYNIKDVTIESSLNVILLIISTLLFCLLPFTGDHINIVSGFGRVIFVILSFLFVLCFYKLTIKLPKFMCTILGIFGMATYGVYLIHPLVYQYLKFIYIKIGLSLNFTFLFSIAFISILLAVLSYKYFEIKMIKYGKKLALS